MTIRVQNLCKKYGSRSALIDFSLELTPGKIVGLMGENGCGKTTFLHILAGLLKDYEGFVSVLGKTPGPETKAHVAFQPDHAFVPAKFSGEEAIAYYRDFYRDFDSEKARQLLSFFELDPKRKGSEMSKGMREKLDIAMIMARHADIYLLDEPISGVDPYSRGMVLQSILDNFSSHALMIISTHLIHDIEPIVDDAVFMHQGSLVMHRQADDIRYHEGKSLDEYFREVYACLPRY